MSPKQLIYRKYGSIDALELAPLQVAPPGPGELLVDVAYAGVNYADVLARRGFYKWAPPLPTCVGFEVSGVVAAIGDGVRDFAIGDRVMAITRFGGYADRIVIEAARAFRVPEGTSLQEAAAIPAVYLTAWHSLVGVARMRAGESILIQAVAGGVGLAALQLAKHFGLVTYGTASSEEKLDFARAHGLDHGIDYVRHDFEEEIARLTKGRGVDIVLDSLGGEGLRKGYRALARCGQLVTIGAAQVAPTGRDPIALARAGLELLRGGLFHPFSLIEENKSIAGVQVLLLWDDLPRVRRGMEALIELRTKGVVKPSIDRVFPLAEGREAHRLLESRRSKGKVLLACAAAS